MSTRPKAHCSMSGEHIRIGVVYEPSTSRAEKLSDAAAGWVYGRILSHRNHSHSRCTKARHSGCADGGNAQRPPVDARKRRPDDRRSETAASKAAAHVSGAAEPARKRVSGQHPG